MQTPEQYIKAGKIVRDVREWVMSNLRPGIGYLEVCEGVEKEIQRRGGEPAFPTGLGVNEVTAHFAPEPGEKRKIAESDLVKLDYGVHVEGYIADTSVTVTENTAYQPLLNATERALQAAIEVIKRDRRIGEIGRAVAVEASRDGFKTISNLSGHTLERYVVHAGKSIPNAFVPNLPVLRQDEVVAIEPFLTFQDAAGYVVDSEPETIFSIVARKRTGSRDLDELLEMIWGRRKSLPFTPRWFAKDYEMDRLVRYLRELEARRLVRGYPTLVEHSRRPVAQFEHTVAIEKDGALILT